MPQATLPTFEVGSKTSKQLLEEQVAFRIAAETLLADHKDNWSDARQAEFDRLMSAKTLFQDTIKSRNALLNQPGHSFTDLERPRFGNLAGANINAPTSDRLAFRDMQTGETLYAINGNERIADHIRGGTQLHQAGEKASFGNYAKALITGDQSQLNAIELQMYAATIGGSSDGGGYMVPAPMANEIIDLARAQSVVIRAGARTMPLTSATLSIGRVTGDPTGYWRHETVDVTASSPTFGLYNLTPRVRAIIIPVSVEWLEDTPNGSQLLENIIAANMALGMDQACLSGSGAGAEPTGIRNEPNVNTLASIGTPTNDDLSNAIGEILTDNYNGDIRDLSFISHPRDAQTLDKTKGGDGHPLKLSPWQAAVKRFSTTSVSITEGGGAESYFVTGYFPEYLVGLRTSGVQLEVLSSGSVTDTDSVTWNAASQMMRYIRAYIRMDCFALRPDWFTVSTGVTT